MPERVLIVDDDPVQRRLIETMVSRFGYESVVAEGGEAALAMLVNTCEPRFDCMVLDLVMPEVDGLGVLAKMREAGLHLPVIVQTAYGGIDNVVSAIRAGAVDFVVKPVGAERLEVSLRNVFATRALADELARLKHGRAGTLTLRDIITRNASMQAVIRGARKAASSVVPVLIAGESGVGKELIARAIHGSSKRRAKAFIAFPCRAIPAQGVEPLLFGRKQEAFPRTTERHPGKFVEASGGTLFLDEVGELPLSAQTNLLRAIENGEVQAIGARSPVKLDVRLILATSRNLASDVKAGRFREDLFCRLHAFPISVPPLRDRPEDLSDLVHHFLARFAAEEGKHVRTISTAALELLASYHWPGNIRQLENAIFRAVVLANGAAIGVNEFPQIAVQMSIAQAIEPSVHQAEAAVAPSTTPHTEAVPLASAITPDFGLSGGRPDGSASGALPLLDAAGELRSLEDIEAEVILFAIAHYNGQMSEVARKLRIGRSTLYRKLDRLGLDRNEDVAEQRDVAAE